VAASAPERDPPAEQDFKRRTRRARRCVGELPLILGDGAYSFVYGPADTPIEQIDAEGHVTYLHHDQQGSIRMLSGEDGSVAGTRTYDAYGKMVEHSDSATSPLGYDGQYTNSATGLIYLRARSYDPATGEFLSVDPLETVTGEPYIYVGDDPLDQSDPSGRCGVLCWGGIVLGGVALATGVGEALGVTVGIGEATASLGAVSATAGFAAAATDAVSCVQGNGGGVSRPE
jgi:RHS repeat-associated protein